MREANCCKRSLLKGTSTSPMRIPRSLEYTQQYYAEPPLSSLTRFSPEEMLRFRSREVVYVYNRMQPAPLLVGTRGTKTVRTVAHHQTARHLPPPPLPPAPPPAHTSSHPSPAPPSSSPRHVVVAAPVAIAAPAARRQTPRSCSSSRTATGSSRCPCSPTPHPLAHRPRTAVA